jgi:tRNA dimethylallyltransferase
MTGKGGNGPAPDADTALSTSGAQPGHVAPEALVITGPTASGKTRLAIAVAQALGGEIISMDSRQVYRGMEIGTARPTLAEREGVPHHGFDRVDPDQAYSAGRFAQDARDWIAGIRRRGRVPILAGGTGFFLRALLHPLFQEPALDQERRRALRAYLETRPTSRLRTWVEMLEPGAAAGDWGGGGRQRLSRRIEVATLSGRPLSWWQQTAASTHAPLRALTFVLALPRAELIGRINERVQDMVRRGLVEEVRGLLGRYSPGDPGMNATGYAELVPFIAGERTLEEAVALTQAATRRYARRQLTWFRNQLADAIRIDAARPLAEQCAAVVRYWKEADL